VKEEQEEIKVQSAGPFRIKDLPFWISDIEEHKTYTIYIVIINTK